MIWKNSFDFLSTTLTLYPVSCSDQNLANSKTAPLGDPGC